MKCLEMMASTHPATQKGYLDGFIRKLQQVVKNFLKKSMLLNLVSFSQIFYPRIQFQASFIFLNGLLKKEPGSIKDRIIFSEDF